MVNFVLSNKCERWVNLHDTSMGQRKIWVPNRNWTHDLLNTGQALYPLSYENSLSTKFTIFIHLSLLMMTLTVLILAVCRKPVTYELSYYPFTPKSDFIDFTLSNARRFYSSKGDPLGVKGLKWPCSPWVLVGQWNDLPPGVREFMGSIPCSCHLH